MLGNPYSGATFFSFFSTLFTRLAQFCSGERFSLASDEVQLLVLVALGIACALMGTFLVLRKMTMFANALSHTSLLGIAIAYICLWKFVGILLATLLTGLLTAFLIEFLHATFKIKKDASIALVFTTLFALGIFLITLFAREVHIGTDMVMGNSDALQPEDVTLAYQVLLLNATFIILFYRQLKISSFDPQFASFLGISPRLFHYLLALLSAVVTLSAFRAMGVLMVLAFLTGPTLIARRFTHSLKKTLLLSSAIALLVVCCGVALSRHLFSLLHIGLSTGGLTVTLLFTLYMLVLASQGSQRKSQDVVL